jgi:hypothetical protein
MQNRILINALGIVDSGGLSVFNKLLSECSVDRINSYYIICNEGVFTNPLKKKYLNSSKIEFNFIVNKGIFHRLYYENFIFRRIIKKKNIRLVYNFSGTAQPFIKTPQLVKIQNLLFFSKAVDSTYIQHKKYILWIRQVVFKRLIFRMMLQRSKYIEIQSTHVKSCLSNFNNTTNKSFYVKSDINVSDSEFYASRQYDFSKKIKFLYIVGPHFEYLHKNLRDFTNAMLGMGNKDVDFEINITLTSEQLNNSTVWDVSLNSKTNFLGYIGDQEKMTKLFCNNTILISTSIIETLGLHVIEGIKNGIITIAPNKEYANTVYGENMFKYELFNKDALFDTIMTVINYKKSHSEKILSIQDDLRKSEMKKFSSILDVFNEVLNVQK